MTNHEERLNQLVKVLGPQPVYDYQKAIEQGTTACTPDELRHYESVEKRLQAMESFGTDEWWLSTDERILVWYSFFETPARLVATEVLIDAVRKFLDRPVRSVEFNYGFDRKISETWLAKEILEKFDAEVFVKTA